MVTVSFFGRLRDMAGHANLAVEVPASETTAFQFRDWLDADRELGGALLAPSVRIAVNEDILTEDVVLRPGDEVSFMPPFSGG